MILLQHNIMPPKEWQCNKFIKYYYDGNRKGLD